MAPNHEITKLNHIQIRLKNPNKNLMTPKHEIIKVNHKEMELKTIINI